MHSQSTAKSPLAHRTTRHRWQALRLVRAIRTNQLLANTSWMLVAEGCARVSRLAAVIALAASLTTSAYGVAMLALVCHEMIRLLTRIGAGAKVVQCRDQDLPDIAANCYSLNWIAAIAIAGLQFYFAEAFAAYYNATDLAQLLQLMALSYLIYPVVAIKVAHLQRENHFKQIGLISAAAIAVDNLATAGLALLGFGVLSVAYAKILAAFVWAVGFYRCNPAGFTPLHVKARFTPKTVKALLAFSLPVFASESLRALRGQVDLLLAGKLLAPEIFGIYAFAKSAGVGFAVSVVNAFSSAIYPKLSSAFRENALREQTVRLLFPLLIIIALFVTQSVLAPWYVPLLFDNAFAAAGKLVALLCLIAIPFALMDTLAICLRSQLKLAGELITHLIGLIVICLGFYWFAPTSLNAFAQLVVQAAFVSLPVCVVVYLHFDQSFSTHPVADQPTNPLSQPKGPQDEK